MVWLDELIWRQFPLLNLLILGVATILLVLFLPRGIVGTLLRRGRNGGATSPRSRQWKLLILNGMVNGLVVGGIYALVGVSLTCSTACCGWSTSRTASS